MAACAPGQGGISLGKGRSFALWARERFLLGKPSSAKAKSTFTNWQLVAIFKSDFCCSNAKIAKKCNATFPEISRKLANFRSLRELEKERERERERERE